MKTKRLISTVMAFIVTATLILANGTIRDEGISSEIVLAHELTSSSH